MLVDTITYSWTIHQIDVPHRKIQFYSDGKDQVVFLPTQENRLAHLEKFWATDTPE